MKILIINTSEKSGGAAVAANRLMKALQKADVSVKMLVRDKQTNPQDVVSVNDSSGKRLVNRFRFLWERGIIFLANRLSRKNLFQVSIANTGIPIEEHPLVKEADIIHLHWINQGFLSLDDMNALIRTGKPIVWTLHDLWPATGICHYPSSCERYELQCYRCPKQVVHPLWDLAKEVFNKKKKLDLQAVHFVGCSEWITHKARLSYLLKNAGFHSIPNPIDTNVFHPVDRNEARMRLHLPLDKYLLFFAAARLSDNRKGANYLIEACRLLTDKYGERIEILLMGKGSKELTEVVPFPINELGYISDDAQIVDAYSSSDLFVIPSLEDNLPNTIMESMACGTPCVGFDTGGIPEMIDHKINGYVAKYKNAKNLADGIDWVLSHGDHSSLSRLCTEKVFQNYKEEVIADRYISLYDNLLTN